MNGSKQGVPVSRKTRRALFAGLLGLVTLWSGVVFATGTGQLGPHAYIDAATDGGGGRIRISWSLQSEPPEGYFFENSRPAKVCVSWSVVENGARGADAETCFTSEVSSQDDLLIDTGIGGDGPATVYSVMLTPYYGNIPLWLYGEDKAFLRIEVTLNA